jgi:NADPH:quinone reductase-like Zn-dependent oxidoreductase
MRAGVLHAYGTPSAGEFPAPAPAEGQLVVDVDAAGVNPFDILLSSGTFYAKPATLPCVVGLDGAGRLADGRRVYFESTIAPYGSAAEQTLVDPRAIIELPAGLDEAVAAALGNAGLAAWLSLQWRAELRPGETVLVLGATGTVGHLAIQVARLLGAGRVIGAGRDPARLERARQAGADACIALGRPDAAEQIIDAAGDGGVDVILDLLWGAPASLSLSAAAVGARLVQVGNLAGSDASLPAGVIRSRAVAVLGYANYHVPRETRHAAYREITARTATGALRVDVERVPLAEIAQAWARQAAGADAKLILSPSLGR